MASPAVHRVRSTVAPVALGGLIATLTPIWAADRAASVVRTARPRTAREVERLSIVDSGLHEIVRRHEPAVVSGLFERLEFTHRPDLAGLRALAAEVTVRFTVRRHRASAPYFLYVGDYGAQVDHVDETTLAEFLDDLFGLPADTDDEADIVTYQLFGVQALDGAIGRIIDEMAAQLGALADRRPDRQASGVWIGSAGVVTPLHHDAWTGLLFQTTGAKRVTMFPPVDRRNIYFSSPFDPTSRWSTLPPRSREADPDSYPRFARAQPYSTRLEAGDTLFIPPYWAHEIEALEPNISIPFRFTTRVRDYLNPGFLRPAYEVFHRKYLADRAVR